MILEIERLINQPIDAVFSGMSDLERRPSWVTPAQERTKITDGPIAVGTRYLAVDKMMGRRLEFVHEITAYEPNQHFAESWDGTMPGRSDARLTEVGGSTRLRLVMEMDTPAYFAVFQPVVKLWAKRGMAKDLARLEGLIGSGF